MRYTIDLLIAEGFDRSYESEDGGYRGELIEQFTKRSL